VRDGKTKVPLLQQKLAFELVLGVEAAVKREKTISPTDFLGYTGVPVFSFGQPEMQKEGRGP